MKTEQRQWTEARGWTPPFTGTVAESFQLVLVFGATAVLRQSELLATSRKNYPAAHLFGCSTAGGNLPEGVTLIGGLAAMTVTVFSEH